MISETTDRAGLEAVTAVSYAGHDLNQYLDIDTEFPYRVAMTSGRDFDWNDGKAESNLAKHGVPFPYATRVFLDAGMVEIDATRAGDGEERKKAIGLIQDHIFAVIYTPREDVTRIISARRCNAKEAGCMAKFKLDLASLPVLTDIERARLDAMSDAELTAAALADADNPPLPEEEAARVEAARTVRRVRAHTGLSQNRFAKRYHINVARLRDLEQGRTKADSALLAYMAVIEREPEAVERALG